jgi:hypothetical protein
MLAPDDSASSIASFEASSEYSDMSNGTKILLITIMLHPLSWVEFHFKPPGTYMTTINNIIIFLQAFLRRYYSYTV